ncbi:DUF6383 domain-containing protein [uncultured Parabacteroides sp.]|uniref:DUF6383 domain-containing protein n=1 Tax=uncultured Parabacteroides sp. TaxID=512312 RepID=UPI0025DFE69D|nr:DUF6383 domain-containing protein [uncultured Parabacteroides sp.]
MNKKFFTLAAAFGLAASSFTAGAQNTSPFTKTLKSGEYYQLVVGNPSEATATASNYYIGVDNAKRDSLVLVPVADPSSWAENTSDLNFWKIETRVAASGQIEYTFTNKASQKVLSLGKLGVNKAASAIMASGVNNWAWLTKTSNNVSTTAKMVASTAAGEAGDAVVITNKAEGASYGFYTWDNNGEKVLAYANNYSDATVWGKTLTPLSTVYAVQPNAAEMTLTELNAIKGGEGFELAFTPDVANNTLPNILAGKTLTAYALYQTNSNGPAVTAKTLTVTNDSKTDGRATVNSVSDKYTLSLEKENPEAVAAAPNQVFIKVGEVTNGAKKKVAMYAVVDTVYINGTTSYTIGMDSVIINNLAATETSGNSEIKPAPNRDLASYLFTVKQDYAAGKLELSVAGTPVAKADGVDYWKDDTNVGKATVPGSATLRVYIAQLGNAKELTVVARPDAPNSTIEAALEKSVITFAQGTAIDNLNTKVAYSVQSVKDKKATGKYFVAGFDYADKDKLTATAASDYIPSTQYGLVHKGGNEYKLYNRETGAALAEGPAFDIDAANGIYRINGCDVALTAMANVKGENVGYKEFSDSDVKFKKIALKLNTFGSNPVYLALKSDKDSVVVASENEDNKIEFKLVANESKAFGDVENDSLVRTSYALKYGDLYLAYDYNLQSYKLSKLLNGGNTVTSNAVVNETMDPAKAPQNDTVYVYFQNVGKDAYALVPELVYTATDASTSFTAAGYYGNSAAWATAAAGLRKEFGIYNTKLVVNSNGTVKNVDFGDSMNSSFAIEDGTPEYDKTIQKPAHQMITLSTDKAMALTITSDNFAAMKRVGQELKADYAADNLKMYVDTATMADVNKPLYYITTGQNVPAECQAKGERNYLISLQDSSEVEGYTSEGLSRVGFVHGVVDADTITLFKGHTVAADTVVIKNDHANVANWAFTANEDGSVSLENQKKGEFIAFRNDVLVMVGSLEEAAQFTMEAVEAPTANDAAPSVTEVKVIAANGAIQVIGAQGKKVVVSNILGQTIANTVLTSSDATIAAPAGIVVVAVEGEEAVKAIVK